MLDIVGETSKAIKVIFQWKHIIFAFDERYSNERYLNLAPHKENYSHFSNRFKQAKFSTWQDDKSVSKEALFV